MPQPAQPGPITAPTPLETTDTPTVAHPAAEAQPDDVAVLVTSDPPAPRGEPAREHDTPAPGKPTAPTAPAPLVSD